MFTHNTDVDQYSDIRHTGTFSTRDTLLMEVSHMVISAALCLAGEMKSAPFSMSVFWTNVNQMSVNMKV